MPRWLRFIRGMLGMGLTFATGAGVLAAVAGGLAWLVGVGSGPATAFVTAASAFWGFTIGVTFSGLMAITARGLSFERLSLLRFAALGAGVGLLFFGLLAVNAWQAWSLPTAVLNATFFALLGGGSATASLMLARRAAPALDPARSRRSIGAE